MCMHTHTYTHCAHWPYPIYPTVCGVIYYLWLDTRPLVTVSHPAKPSTLRCTQKSDANLQAFYTHTKAQIHNHILIVSQKSVANML